jgi:hypothetical protein
VGKVLTALKPDPKISDHRKAVQHLLSVAMAITRCEAISLMLTTGKISRCLAQIGLPNELYSCHWDWDKSPYDKCQTIVEKNADYLKLSPILINQIGAFEKGLCIRMPLLSRKEYIGAIHLFARRDAREPSKTEMTLLSHLAAALSKELVYYHNEHQLNSSSIKILDTSEEFLSRTDQSSFLSCVLDSKLNVRALSNSFAELLNMTRVNVIGKNYDDLNVPMKIFMRKMYLSAIEVGISTPKLEIISHNAGLRRSYLVGGSPFRQIDSDEDFINITVEPKDCNLINNLPIIKKNSKKLSLGGDGEIAGRFLLDTLVVKPSIRSCNTTRYVSVRSWQVAMKKYQVSVMSSVMKNLCQQFVASAARECAAELEHLFGGASCQFVVPIPNQANQIDDKLTLAMAKVMALYLGIPVLEAFENVGADSDEVYPDAKVSSKLKMVQPVPGTAVLFQAMTSAGQQFHEASELLKEGGTVSFAISWIDEQ